MDGWYYGKWMEPSGMWGHGIPVPVGGVAKHRVLPSLQSSSATEDAVKKQEPTNKKSQTRGL